MASEPNERDERENEPAAIKEAHHAFDELQGALNAQPKAGQLYFDNVNSAAVVSIASTLYALFTMLREEQETERIEYKVADHSGDIKIE